MYGFFQGCPLATFAWNKYIDPLARRLAERFTNNGTLTATIFADDIMLLPPVPCDAQPMVDCTADWCNEYNMVGGISKMGVIWPSAVPARGPVLMWNGQAIPHTDTYQYLGCPTGADGIDYIAHITHRITKATKHLRILQGRGSHWPADAKTVIARTFLLPSVAFGAGLLGHATPAMQKQILNIWTLFHIEMLKWIFNVRSVKTCGLTVLEPQTNIPSPKRQLTEWAVRLTDHLKRASPSNPTSYSIARAASALFRCRTHPEWEKWHDHNRERPPQSCTRLKTWLENHRGYDSSRLAAYLEAGRRGWGRTDLAIGIPCKQIRFEALTWRRGGGAFLTKKCTGCRSRFTRSHLKKCDLWQQICTHHHWNIDSFPTTPSTALPYLTPFDTLLNQQEWTTFHNAFVSLSSLII